MQYSCGHYKLEKLQLPQGVTQIIFWQGVWPKVWNPYPYLRIFLPQKKTADLTVFPKFSHIGTHL